jgi:hypothetical protein
VHHQNYISNNKWQTMISAAAAVSNCSGSEEKVKNECVMFMRQFDVYVMSSQISTEFKR